MSRSSGAIIRVGVVTVAVSAVLACSDKPVTAVIERAREQTPAPSPTWFESVWNRADNREYPPEATSWSSTAPSTRRLHCLLQADGATD